MKRIIVDAACFKDKVTMFEELHRAFGRENFFGNNLDAFHDCLTMIFEPTEIVIRNYAYALASLGAYANAFWHVLDDSAEENRNLRILVS